MDGGDEEAGGLGGGWRGLEYLIMIRSPSFESKTIHYSFYLTITDTPTTCKVTGVLVGEVEGCFVIYLHMILSR